jgi:alkylated DNA repair dioxygenase AlkB
MPLPRDGAADALVEIMLTEYPAGAGIGGHRDAPMFDLVAGVSVLGACRFRFDRGGGPARHDWRHGIPPTKASRYSITFRTLAPTLTRQSSPRCCSMMLRSAASVTPSKLRS